MVTLLGVTATPSSLTVKADGGAVVRLSGSLKFRVMVSPEDDRTGAGVVSDGPWVSIVELFDVTSWDANDGASIPVASCVASLASVVSAVGAV
jgi:hypothetical protein